MDLRYYQKQAVEAVKDHARKGIVRQVLVLPTGSGKTVVFAQFPAIVKSKGKKTLILAHREELLEQAKEKLLSVDSTLKVAIEQADKKAEDQFPNRDFDVLVASVPTLGRAKSKRIEKFDPSDFSMIIIDESHHATSETYKNILRYFDVLKGEIKKPNGRVLLGVTATPSRADHNGLEQIFDKIVFNYSMRKAIQDGFLADIKAVHITTGTDLTGVHTRGGDFVDSELAEAVNTPERNNLIVSSYKEVADNSKAICFGSDVEHVKSLVTAFRSAGYTSESVLGETPKEERTKTLKDFKEGKINVLVNCAVLTEGYDEPSIETVLMARPTKSSVLFSQMVGRGTRIFKGKPHLNLIDFVDNTGQNQISSIYTLFGLKKNLRPERGGGFPLKHIEKAEKILDVCPDYAVDTIEDWSDENIEKIIKEVDIFAQAKLPDVVQEFSSYSWEGYGEGFRLCFPPMNDEQQKEELLIESDMLNNISVTYKKLKPTVPSYDNSYKKWATDDEVVLATYPELRQAFEYADGWVFRYKPEYNAMLNQKSKWRKDDATEGQLNLLEKMRIATPKGLSKGQASILISKALEARRRK